MTGSPSRRVSHEAHRDELERASGVSDDVMQRAGLWSESDPGELAKMTGISRKLWTEDHLPALVFPYRAPGEQDPSIFRVKPLRPLAFPKADGTVELRKYVQPKGHGVRLFFPPGLLASERQRRDANLSLLVTEGEKKTLSAEAYGMLCVGLSGVSCWSARRGRKRVLHDDWQHLELRGRRVFLVFDSDATTNIRGVRAEEKKLAKALRGAGANPHVVRLPEGPDGAKWGLDDFLVHRGAEALRDLCRKAKPAAEQRQAAATTAPAAGTAMTDLGNAERLAQRHGGDLRYVPAWRSWLRWDGVRWARASEEEITGLAIDTARSIYEEVAAAGKRGDRDQADALLQHAKRSESSSALTNMVRVARALEGVSIDVDDLDANPWLLCCPNGVLDLRTGDLREHRREDLITRCSGVDFDPEATSDTWERFVADVVQGDPDFLAFLQVSAGYALTGDTSEERMWLVQGPGGTGKSTFLEALRGVLGDYACTAEFATFTRRDRNDHGPRPDVARLAGARLVVASEGEDSQRLSEALVKNVTGGERITARFLYGSDFEFRPQFKLWLATNHEPHVRHDDSGIWRRLLHLPFTREIAEEQRDPKLKAELVDVERSGAAVLAWAVRGLARWREEGIRVPESVRQSTAAFRDSQDVLGEFLSEKCVLLERAVTATKDLKIAYKEWRTEVGLTHAPGWQRVTQRLRDEGGEYVNTWVKGRKCRAWQGIGLRADSEWEDFADDPPGTLHSSDSSSRQPLPRACAHDNLRDLNCQNCETFQEESERGERF